MKSFCPRCESPIPAGHSGCKVCGYRWYHDCPSCGKRNVYQAVYCGECGQGISLKTRLRRKWEKTFSLESRTKFRNMGAGFIFGALLFLFSFGSMGMIGKNVQKVEPVWETQTSKEIFLSEAAKRTSVSLQAWKGKENLTREATQADLVRIGNLFVESFSQTKTPDQLRFFGNFRQSELYLQSLEKTLSENITGVPVQRSDAVIFLFRLISDLFEIQPPEEASDRYSDIPKYHYINLPIDTLEGLGLHLGRETSVFGGEDSVSLGWLSNLSMELIKVCETHIIKKELNPMEGG